MVGIEKVGESALAAVAREGFISPEKGAVTSVNSELAGG